MDRHSQLDEFIGIKPWFERPKIENKNLTFGLKMRGSWKYYEM